jgi:cytochrome P450
VGGGGEPAAERQCAANHDPAVFPDGGRFDLDRHPARLLSFG